MVEILSVLLWSELSGHIYHFPNNIKSKVCPPPHQQSSKCCRFKGLLESKLRKYQQRSVAKNPSYFLWKHHLEFGNNSRENKWHVTRMLVCQYLTGAKTSLEKRHWASPHRWAVWTMNKSCDAAQQARLLSEDLMGLVMLELCFLHMKMIVTILPSQNCCDEGY